ncbi:hypothetical protein SAMN06265219_1083 [Gracilimonas mengyeensis]|uniref:TIGR00725 family protein n=2 Tax=Gracilimonas mengyeensis TaxID=1302730 RepID=A0A521DDD9_9BACT|nr:hypothetical protein SAMN06265219_1083 [Gracilimonas mengyeensis]
MGPGSGATSSDLDTAYILGNALAQEGYLVLTGGRASGVMESAMKGAKAAGGTTIGILPSPDGANQSEFVDIAIKTDTGSGRNNINVLTSDVVIAVGVGAGTASEIALAIKNDKPVILMNQTDESLKFFYSLTHPRLYQAGEVEATLQLIKQVLKEK